MRWRSWKTGVAGIAGIGAIVVKATAGEPLTEADLGTLTASIGLLFAKDFNVSGSQPAQATVTQPGPTSDPLPAPVPVQTPAPAPMTPTPLEQFSARVTNQYLLAPPDGLNRYPTDLELRSDCDNVYRLGWDVFVLDLRKRNGL